jgi:hypothetical protein
MPTAEGIPAELKAMRNRLFELLVLFQTREGEQGPVEEESPRLAIWSAARELDSLFNEAPRDLDLTRDAPTTRRILYEFMVRQYFNAQLLADPGEVFVPAHTPEECGLSVFFQHGRWFVTWIKLEEDMSRPEAEHRELMIFEKNEDGAIILQGL